MAYKIMICAEHFVYIHSETPVEGGSFNGGIACAKCVERQMQTLEQRIVKLENFARQQAKTNLDVSQLVFPHRVIGPRKLQLVDISDYIPKDSSTNPDLD